MRIINEPTVAALAYGFNQKEEQKIAVYDFGGGTFDISVLEVDEGFVQVKSTNGDTHLGGDDVDQVLIDWIVKEFNTEHRFDLFSLPGSEMAQQRIRQTAEQVKKDLSLCCTNCNHLSSIPLRRRYWTEELGSKFESFRV